VMQKKRFFAEFSPDPDEKESKLERPDDYKATFAGNIDDCFRIGLSFSKNTLKLYAEFYAADVIIASPLGLRTIIGGEGEKQDYDFLSSIEMLILDQTDVFLMQNWEHLTHIFDHLNIIPKQSHGTDYSRVRMSTVNGCAKYYRQTMLFSGTHSPEVNGLFNKYCSNYNGKVRYTNTNTNGSISQIASQISQVFHRIPSTNFAEDPDTRFQYFIKKVVPEFQSNLFAGTAVFIPSYFDFVRVRNHFKKERLSFVQISEYSKRSNITRSRAMFLDKSKHYLLFTERFNFFYRYKLKGIRHIIFYQLPQFPHFYSEIVNSMMTSGSDSSSSVSCTVLYSRFDGFKLEAVVGSTRCKQLLGSSKDTHMLVTG
jgi:U3 small nucleolar RNA-associated protein 25